MWGKPTASERELFSFYSTGKRLFKWRSKLLRIMWRKFSGELFRPNIIKHDFKSIRWNKLFLKEVSTCSCHLVSFLWLIFSYFEFCVDINVFLFINLDKVTRKNSYVHWLDQLTQLIFHMKPNIQKYCLCLCLNKISLSSVNKLL